MSSAARALLELVVQGSHPLALLLPKHAQLHEGVGARGEARDGDSRHDGVPEVFPFKIFQVKD